MPNKDALEFMAGVTEQRGWRKPTSEVTNLRKADIWTSGDLGPARRYMTLVISWSGFCMGGRVLVDLSRINWHVIYLSEAQ
jgi:hypothetical protein